MFKNVRNLFFLLLFLMALPVVATAEVASERGGKVILNLDEANPDGEVKEVSFPQGIANMVAIGAYFDKEYPGDMIYWDFTEEMRKFFPKLEGNELDNRVMLVRDAVRLYRYGRDLYYKIKQKLLVPEDPPLVYDDDEYEKKEKYTYVESDDLVVINDFKKVVSYSSQNKDLKAYKAKAIRDQLADKSDTSSPIKKINDMFARLSWKDIFFSSAYDKDPLTEGKGLGAWEIKDNIYVRLETEYSTVNQRSSQRALVHFYLPNDLVLRLDEPFTPAINLKGENLESWTASLPVFDRVTVGDKSYVGRGGHVPIALELNLKDPEKPLDLTAQIDAFICSAAVCKRYSFSPKLVLESGFGYSSLAYNYIYQSFLALPKSENDDIVLQSLSVGDNPAELMLRIETDENPSQLDVFIEGDDNLVFQAPRLSVSGDVVDAFLQADKPIENPLGKKFEVTVKTQSFSVKKIMEVGKVPPLEILGSKMSLGLLIAAVLGGFLLNFMPCVFPVLALKLMSVLRFGEGQEQKVRRNFLYTLLGIWAGFSLLIIFLIGLKYLGVALGWGIQFQEPWFLVLMTFAVMMFLLYVFGLFQFSFNSKSFFMPKSEKLKFSLVGGLIVLMSTPCTAPYLGTVVGFALGSSYGNIALILYAVALGLSLPYLLVYFVPEAVLLLPKPGTWMVKIEWLMRLMLFLTLVWLLSILYVQVSLDVLVRMCLYLFLFAIVLLGRHKLLSLLNKSPMAKSLRNKKHRIFSIVSVVLALLLWGGATLDVSSHFNSTAQEKLSPSGKELFDYRQIQDLLAQGKTVLVKVDARWCLTCQFNDFTVLNTDYIQDKMKRHNIVMITLDWTSYNPEILEFMKKYGRSGVPFYVLFSPKLANGMVLPEILTEKDFSAFLESYSF